jgi:ATP-dependent Zn protease
MPIEKDLKNTSEKVNRISAEKPTRVFYMKKLISKHRLNTRDALLSNPMNLTTILAIVPFSLAFFQFLNHKASFNPKSQFGQSFFGKTLPIFANFKPQLNYDTFQYISNKEFLFLNSNLAFGQPKFLAKLKKAKSSWAKESLQPDLISSQLNDLPKSEKELTGIACNFYLLPSGNFYSWMSTIDELPSYLQGLRQNSKKLPNPLFNFSEKGTVNTAENISQESVKEKNQGFLTKKRMSGPENIVFGKGNAGEKDKTNRFFQQNEKELPKIKNQLSLVKKPFGTNKNFPESVSVDNSFYKDRIQFYKILEQLDTEVENLFIQKSISSSGFAGQQRPGNGLLEPNVSEEILVLRSLLNSNQGIEDDLVIETILRNLEKFTISTENPGFRLMSGYQYPDTTSDDLYWYYNQNKFFRKKVPVALKPDVPDHFLASKNYDLRIKKLPSVLIETKNITLKSPDNDKVLFNGPSLLLDSQTGLDWKLFEETVENQLRSWFHHYISPFNPLNPLRTNFFNFKLSGKKLDFSEFKNNSLFPEKYIQKKKTWDLVGPGLENSFSTSQASFHFTTQTEYSLEKDSFLGSPIKSLEQETEREKTKFIRGVKLNLANQDKEDRSGRKEFVPVIVVNQPSASFPKAPNLGSNTKLFQGYSPFFDLGVTGNPDYSFSLEATNPNNFITKHASGRYIKLLSVFSKKARFVGSGATNFEPLTSHSWLVITQISFAVFILQVMRMVYDIYGRELLGYLLDLVASLGVLDESLKQEIEMLMGQRDKGFRIVSQSRKNFTDIVGIQKFLPEIYEVVWFLRNSARDFPLSKTLPRGILLTGPPGTGKTLLVQAIAGEAQVPVVVLSGSSLIEPGESGSVKLEMVFQEARQVAPCIVFIDEIDTLSEKRSGVVHNPMGDDDLVESLTSFENSIPESTLEQLEAAREKEDDQQQAKHSSPQNPQQLSLLTQLLIELDGMRGRDGVIVIGATNRPEVLDSALLRPGRFDKVIQVGLPTHQKRVEILQYYGHQLGYQSNIPWDYLGARTAGFTAADLAALMNESAIKAILGQTTHTIQTIEHGIDRLTTSENEKYTLIKFKSSDSISQKSLSSVSHKVGAAGAISSFGTEKTFSVASKLSILRLAYYQAGKILLSYFLETHPKSVVGSLWPRRPSIRSLQIAANLKNSVFEFSRLCEINDRIIGCYAGKAAEFLFVEKFSSRGSPHLSTLGLDDLLFAQKLIYSMLEKSFFYSKKSYIQKTITLAPNINTREFRLIPEKLDLYSEVIETIETPPMKKTLELNTSSLKSNEDAEFEKLNSQIYYSIPWWQQETSDALEFVEKNFSNWSRLYLSNPELNERNPEWFPPDEFYHTSSGLKNVKNAVANFRERKNQSASLPNTKTNTENAEVKYPPQKVNYPWNDVANLTRDYPAHSLVLQSFNKALVVLNENRELLDRIVVELLYHETLRQPEIEKLVKDFQPNKSSGAENQWRESLEKQNQVEFIESSWGPKSRKVMPRWIDFGQFQDETT